MQKTWKPMSKNYTLLREFSLFLRARFTDIDDAFAGFTNKPFGRLNKQDFIDNLTRLQYGGDAAEVFKFPALGHHFIVKKHFKWAWNLLEPEELVRTLHKLDRRRSTKLFASQEAAQAVQAKMAPLQEKAASL